MKGNLRAVLVGAGKIGAGYSFNKELKEVCRYATHADVLESHPNFEWVGVSDISKERCREVAEHWGVSMLGADLSEIRETHQPNVLILATPPHNRLDIIKQFANLKAVIIEKPIDLDISLTRDLINYCNHKSIVVQVNLWMRAESLIQSLKSDIILAKYGKPLFARGIYGGGILNNGIHLIDFFRYLFGEVVSQKALSESSGEGNISFSLSFANNLNTFIQATDYKSYRIFEAEIFFEKGVLRLDEDFFRARFTPTSRHSQIDNYDKLDFENSINLQMSTGEAFYDLYSNLYNHLKYGEPLVAEGSDVLKSEEVIDELLKVGLKKLKKAA